MLGDQVDAEFDAVLCNHFLLTENGEGERRGKKRLRDFIVVLFAVTNNLIAFSTPINFFFFFYKYTDTPINELILSSERAATKKEICIPRLKIGVVPLHALSLSSNVHFSFNININFFPCTITPTKAGSCCHPR